MELRHLRYFAAVAQEGSLTKAAARLGIQQPPLGQQVRSLEAELGVQLFDRAAKRITLNASGKVFLQSALRLLAEADEMVEHVRRFDKGERGRLIVGFTSSASADAANWPWIAASGRVGSSSHVGSANSKTASFRQPNVSR